MKVPNFETALSETATLVEISGYIFDNYNNDPQFLAALDNNMLPWPSGVQEVLSAHDVLLEEFIDSFELYIQTC